jgi:hypothetical protein
LQSGKYAKVFTAGTLANWVGQQFGPLVLSARPALSDKFQSELAE